MRRAFVLMALTGLNIIAVFTYQWYVLFKVGPGEISDALFAAMVVPQLVLNVVSGSLSFVLVPMLSVTDRTKFDVGVSDFFVALSILFGCLALVLFVFAPYWVPLTVPGFSAETKLLTISLARIQLVGMFFTGIGAVLVAAYQSRHRFVYPASASAAASLCALLFLVLAWRDNDIRIAAWGLVSRPFLQFSFQLPIALPLRWPNWRNERFRQALAKLRPLIMGTIYYKTDQLVDRLLVSMAPAGVLSLLHLSQQMYSAGNQVLVAALDAPAVPALANHAVRREWHAFKARMMRTLQLLVLSGGIVFALIFYPGHYVLGFVFGHGKFSAGEIHELWLIMLALGGVWMTGLTGQILSSSFYAMSDTTTPTLIGAIGFTVGIGLKIAGFYLFGVIGVAIGSGIYMAGNSVASWIVLKRRLRTFMLEQRSMESSFT